MLIRNRGDLISSQGLLRSYTFLGRSHSGFGLTQHYALAIALTPTGESHVQQLGNSDRSAIPLSLESRGQDEFRDGKIHDVVSYFLPSQVVIDRVLKLLIFVKLLFHSMTAYILSVALCNCFQFAPPCPALSSGEPSDLPRQSINGSDVCMSTGASVIGGDESYRKAFHGPADAVR